MTKRKKVENTNLVDLIVETAEEAYARVSADKGSLVKAIVGEIRGSVNSCMGRDEAFLNADAALEDMARCLKVVRRHLRAEVKNAEDFAQCNNCTKVFSEESLDEPAELAERTEPGGTVPSGQCPECGCLCYPVVDHDTGVLAEV